MTSLVRNLNDRSSQRRNSIPFDNEYYFALSLAVNLRSLPPRARCLAKKEIQNIIFKHQMSANNFSEGSKTYLITVILVGQSNHSATVFHHPLCLALTLVTYSQQSYAPVQFHPKFHLNLE